MIMKLTNKSDTTPEYEAASASDVTSAVMGKNYVLKEIKESHKYPHVKRLSTKSRWKYVYEAILNNKSTENEDFNDGFLNNFKKHHNVTLNITNELNKKNKGDLSLTIYVSTSYFNYTEANQLIRKQLKKNNRFV